MELPDRVEDFLVGHALENVRRGASLQGAPHRNISIEGGHEDDARLWKMPADGNHIPDKETKDDSGFSAVHGS